MPVIKNSGRSIIEKQTDLPSANRAFLRLLWSSCIASGVVTGEVNKIGLIEILGKAGSANIQGKSRQKLYVFVYCRPSQPKRNACCGKQENYHLAKRKPC